jgi:tetratricopeptide (TPR) repeat protein
VLRRLSISLLTILATATATAGAQPREEDRRYKLGEGYERAGDMRGAARVYRELLDADPQSELYFQGVRRAYTALGMYAELLPLVEERAKARPSDVDLGIVHAELLHRTGKREEAKAAWRRALESGNFQELTFALVAQSQTEVRAFEPAIETYRGARDRSGDRYLFADQLAWLYTQIGRFEDAAREYLGILGSDPDRLPVVKRAMATMTGNPTGLAAATAVVEAAVERNPDFEPNLELLSWLYDEGANFDAAFELAKKLDRARNGKGSSIYAYADRALRERRFDAAVAALDYFMATYGRDNPLYSIALLTYARTLEERHRAGAGAGSASDLVERYEELAEREEGTAVAAEAMLRAARLQAYELDAPEEARETLDALVKAKGSEPVLPEAYLLLGDLRVREGRLDEARSLYDRSASTTDGSEEGFEIYDAARLRRAELLLYRGAFKEAVDSLTELTRLTTSGVTNDALTYLFLLQESLDRADSALAEYVAGRLALVQHRWRDAAARFASAAALAPKSTLADEATLGRATALGSAGDNAGAVDVLLAFVSATPEALAADRALYRAAEIVERALSDRARALELYTRLLNEYPKSQHATAARSKVRELREGRDEG